MESDRTIVHSLSGMLRSNQPVRSRCIHRLVY